MQVRLSKHETNDLLVRLEERKYGHRFNSMELAQKAGVSLDDVNRLERQLPIEDERIAGRLAKVLGIAPELLPKIGGQQELSSDELYQLYRCLEPEGEAQLGAECQRMGIMPK